MSDLKAKLEQLRAEREAAEKSISVDDQAEIDLRAEIEKEQSLRDSAKTKARDLDLARRLDAAQDALGDVKCDSLAIQGFDDTFIVFRSGSAHKRWAAAQQAAASQEARGKQANRERINIQYAIDCIHDWNGITDFSAQSGTENANKLRMFLETNPGVVAPITDLAGTLNGAFAEERSKSR